MKGKISFFIAAMLIWMVSICAQNSQIVFKMGTENVPYRIPALAKCSNGNLIAIADYRYCKADIGYGPIDLHYRISHDNGRTWGEERILADGDDKLKGNDWRYAFGDACVVAAAESSEVVMFCVGGHVGFFESTNDNPQHIVRFRSKDNGETWDAGICVTDDIYNLYNQPALGKPSAIFLTSGRILQSQKIKVDEYYRLYIAHPIKGRGVGVIYSDDFGESWKVLGSPTHLPSTACDESVVEELPDGSVLLSVRTQGKRMVNIFKYKSEREAVGSWGKEGAAEGIDNVNACNGELLVVPAMRKSDGKTVHLVLHSLPQSSERKDVGFYFKETTAKIWKRGLKVSSLSSCYSTMLQLNDGSIALLYEENEYDGGYDIIFKQLSLEEITDGAYSNYWPTPDNLEARKAFEGFRFGIFLHWGIYSEFAQGEWYLNSGKLLHSEYQKAASCFYPIRFNAKEWVKAIKASGAKYITFTSRHHDGFSMWKTKESSYNIVDATPFKRDVIKELSDACKQEDIRFQLYYSILDWMREDYPLGRTGHDTGRQLRPDYDSYFQFMKNQIHELLCNYEGVEGIWLDGYWDHDSDSIPFDWRMREFYQYIHSLKPACLIGNNHHITPIEGEDFQMFERDLPGENKAGLSGQDISILPLEMCQTMNGMWGYKVADQDYKSSRELINLLIRAASKGSNLLLNIGPQPNGELPATALERLKDIGEWLNKNGDAIYGTTRGEEYPWGVTTRKGDVTFLHVLENVSEINIPLSKKPQTLPPSSRYDKKNKLLTIQNVEQYDIIRLR